MFAVIEFNNNVCYPELNVIQKIVIGRKKYYIIQEPAINNYRSYFTSLGYSTFQLNESLLDSPLTVNANNGQQIKIEKRISITVK